MNLSENAAFSEDMDVMQLNRNRSPIDQSVSHSLLFRFRSHVRRVGHLDVAGNEFKEWMDDCSESGAIISDHETVLGMFLSSRVVLE